MKKIGADRNCKQIGADRNCKVYVNVHYAYPAGEGVALARNGIDEKSGKAIWAALGECHDLVCNLTMRPAENRQGRARPVLTR